MEREQVFIPATASASPQRQVAALVGTALATVLVLSGLLGRDPLAVIRQALQQMELTGWLQLALLAIAGIALVMISIYAPRSRLHVGPDGIALRSRFPNWVQALERRTGSWSADWAAVEAVELRPVRHAHASELLVIMRDGTVHRLAPGQWRRHRSENIDWTNRFTRLDAVERTRLMETNPLLRSFAGHGFTVRWVPEAWPLTHGSDLTRSPAGRTALAAMVLLAAYAAVDTGLLSETYAGQWPWGLLLLSGAVVAVISAVPLWRFGTDLRRYEVAGLALMLGLAGALAAWPGLLRLNMWTDDNGLAPYEYVLKTATRLEPKAPGLPALEAPRNTLYWAGQEAGTTHTFHMRRGMLPFWQYDVDRVVARMRSWFEQNRGR